MDLFELRLLGAAGILAVGIVLSVLGMLAASAVEWVGRVSRARAGRASGPPAVGPRADLRVGRIRC